MERQPTLPLGNPSLIGRTHIRGHVRYPFFTRLSIRKMFVIGPTLLGVSYTPLGTTAPRDQIAQEYPLRLSMLIRFEPAGFRALTASRVSFLLDPAGWRVCIGFQHMLLGTFGGCCCPQPRSDQAILSRGEDRLHLMLGSISKPEGKHCFLTMMKIIICRYKMGKLYCNAPRE